MEARAALFETMRWTRRCLRLPQHLERMCRSAEVFDIPFDRQRAQTEALAATSGLDGSRMHRVKLTLWPDGQFDVCTTCVDPDDLIINAVAIYPEPLPSDALWARHKTTERSVYEAAHAYARQLGADEAIVMNERGEVMEGSYTNLWVMQGENLVTPPVEATGGLPGIHRCEMLRRDPMAREGILKERDIHDAQGVFVGNALRGLQRVAVLDA
ncbi:aminotransferase class IV family protein [soil metagenome]